ncbi:MAG TPA: DUF1292 domain-containing protein [Bacilli bacterium]|nr:DUF1292 domain-containing protein [Bacilli bacterium]
MEQEKLEVGEVFALVDENEEEQDVEVLGKMELGEHTYIAVSLVQDLEETGEEDDVDVFFLRVEADGEMAAIESDEEFEQVTKAFEEAMSEQA